MSVKRTNAKQDMILQGFPFGEKGHEMNGYPCEGCKKRDKNTCLDKNCKPWRDWFRGEWRRTCEMVKELDRKVSQDG